MRFWLALPLALIAEPAQAHDPFGSNSFWSGLLHSWFAPVQIMTLAGLALQSRQYPSRLRSVVVASFALGLLAGSIAIARGVGETRAPELLLLIVIGTGALTAAALTPPASVTALIVLAAGAAIALDSPPQAVQISAALLIQLGTGLGAALTLLILGEIGARMQHPWLRIALRLLGAWLAAIAILTLAFRLAR